MLCRRAETQAFGNPAEQLSRKNIQQSAPVVEHENEAERSERTDD
ncbi:MAG: hypothetical protein U0N38_00960 [Acutalibacteraceae bacterium]